VNDTNLSAVVLVVRHDSRLLVVSRRDGLGFSLPGGKVDPGETIKIAACRELSEEVGCVATPGRLVLLHKGLSGSGRITHLYYAHKITNAPYARESGTTIGWFKLDDLLSATPFASFYRQALPDGVEHLKPTELLY
jgi:8-oxo-dGTP pyrophosphatase MutT (NUDIX family)